MSADLLREERAFCPIQGTWEWLSLSAIKAEKTGTTVTAPGDFDAELHIETTTIMFADVVESVRLIEQDELANVTRIRALLKRLADAATRQHQGRVLERRGDGLLLSFPDARFAASFALAAHAAADDENGATASDNRIALRVGIHTAALLSDDHALYGNGINLASRVTALASPGETAISADVRDQLVDGLHGDMVDLGECFMRNVEQPLRVFRLGPAADNAARLPTTDRVIGQSVPTLAVIPLRSTGAQAEHGAVGDLVADNVIGRLSSTQSLRIISRLSCAAFRDVVLSSSEIAGKLGADYLLSGTCSVMGDRVIAFFELCEGRSGTVVWAEQIRAPLEVLLAEECEMADRVATEVQVRIIDHQMARLAEQPLPTLRSYTLFLGGLSLMHRQSEADFNRARELFEYLKGRHPRNAVPRAWLGKWHMLKIVQGWTTDVHNDARSALVEASRALEIEPQNSLCSTVKGVIHAYLQKDFVTAGACFQRALECNPNDALARLQQAALSGWSGHADHARAHAVEALRLSPLDPHLYFLHSLIAGAFLGAGEYELAEEHARQSIRANCMHVATYKVLAMAQSLQGKCEEAQSTARRLLTLSPNFSVHQFAERSPWAQHPKFDDLRHALAAAGVPNS